MATNTYPLTEIGPDGLAREAPVIALTEKNIEEEQVLLKRYIEENYSKIRDVERELANLTFEVKLTAGPKKAALEHLRKKIELSNERIHAAKIKEGEARKEKVLPCTSSYYLSLKKGCLKQHQKLYKMRRQSSRNYVQESTSTQFSRLEELKRRLEALNPTRSSRVDVPVHEDGKSVQQSQSSATVANTASRPHSTASTGGMPENLQGPVNDHDAPVTNGQNQLPNSDGEGRGKKRSSNLVKGGKGVTVLGKGRGITGSGWTGAGFDVDNRT